MAVPFTGQPGPIAYHSGVIYASAYDHLDAINATTGAILWSYTPSQMTADLHLEAVANGRVFIRDGNANQNIDAVSSTTGAREWTFATDEPIQNAAYGSGTLYVGSGDRYVHAVNATTGVQKWSQTYGFGSPYVAFANATVYMASLQDVTALKPSNGHVIWTRTLPAGNNATPSFGDGHAVFTDGYEMSSLSTTANGTLQWSNRRHPRQLQLRRAIRLSTAPHKTEPSWPTTPPTAKPSGAPTSPAEPSPDRSSSMAASTSPLPRPATTSSSPTAPSHSAASNIAP